MWHWQLASSRIKQILDVVKFFLNFVWSPELDKKIDSGLRLQQKYQTPDSGVVTPTPTPMPCEKHTQVQIFMKIEPVNQKLPEGG